MISRYPLCTHGLGLRYRYERESIITVYDDADSANDTWSCKSISETVTIMADDAVLWYSGLREVVAVSSRKAEFISLCSSTKDI